MANFTDNKKRTWTLEINAGHVVGKKFQAIGWDFEKETKEGTYESLFDPFKLVVILWTLCEKQADIIGVDEVDFAEGLTGEIINDAQEKLMEAILTFTQRSKISKSANNKLKNIFEHLDGKAVANLDIRLNETFSSLRGTSGSENLTDSPSDNSG